MREALLARYFGLLLMIAVLGSCNARKSSGRTVVGIQPYGRISRELSDTLAAFVTKTYGFAVCVLPKQAIPAEAFVNVKMPRYRADKILKIQEQWRPDSLTYILGITPEDISTTKRDARGEIQKPVQKFSDWGVLGLGYRPGHSSVVSTFRIGRDRERITDLLKKICIHELGHNLGLDHCTVEGCVMTDAAETIATIERVQPSLCAACRKKIKATVDNE
ncbi:matrixin family metalloprotease [Chryseolinea lacunae]|uniref:Matrixin family metalloprotease n=1 Tax=Chryseolinea lacunae TaxID=2801331 RepID=A0ABS1KR22_9BACT|nr:matrixin family metalloprotease [Chryseolinea lacunae]MBL0741894.1 matrixin family metalloprotease [Chryseolinea lacunae]